MSHLYGAILKPSHIKTFTDWWISSLPVIPVSHFHPPESGQEKTIQDTSGLGSQTEFDFFGQDSASLKMSKDTSPLDSAKSSESWKALVIKARGDYSLRVKSARLTSGSGSLSWPTIRASEYKDVGPVGSKSHDHMLGKHYLCAVVTQEAHGQAAPALWPTATATNRVRNEETMAKCAAFRKRNANQNTVPLYLEETVLMHQQSGQAAPANPSTHGSRQGLSEQDWRTPGASDGEVGVMEMREGCAGKYKLRDHVVAVQKQWATLRDQDSKHSLPTEYEMQSRMHNQLLHMQTGGKLNPRWVETLMGLPVGWVMPSCKSPVTIAQTSFACSATESCQPPQSELFAH